MRCERRCRRSRCRTTESHELEEREQFGVKGKREGGLKGFRFGYTSRTYPHIRFRAGHHRHWSYSSTQGKRADREARHEGCRALAYFHRNERGLAGNASVTSRRTTAERDRLPGFHGAPLRARGASPLLLRQSNDGVLDLLLAPLPSFPHLSRLGSRILSLVSTNLVYIIL